MYFILEVLHGAPIPEAHSNGPKKKEKKKLWNFGTGARVGMTRSLLSDHPKIEQK
jgi:hypothetical protein